MVLESMVPGGIFQGATVPVGMVPVEYGLGGIWSRGGGTVGRYYRPPHGQTDNCGNITFVSMR